MSLLEERCWLIAISAIPEFKDFEAEKLVIETFCVVFVTRKPLQFTMVVLLISTTELESSSLKEKDFQKGLKERRKKFAYKVNSVSSFAIHSIS